MAPAYQDVKQDREGRLYFVAKFPAFKKLGRRFEAIKASSQGEEEDEITESRLEQVQKNLSSMVEDIQGHFSKKGLELRQKVGATNRLAPLHDDPVEETEKLIAQLEQDILSAQGIEFTPLSKEEMEKMQAECDAIKRGLETDEKPTDLPRDTVIVECGKGRQVTQNQKVLAKWLSKNQDHVVAELKAAFREYYRELLPSNESNLGIKAGEKPFLPQLIKGNETDNLIRIRAVFLHKTKCKIGLLLDCAYMEEFPLGALITNHIIKEIGSDDLAYVC